MSTDHDVTRIVRSWLHEDAHEDADRVLSLVLDELDTTQQRRAPWLAWRFSAMSNSVRIGLAAAAVLVVAVVGINLLSDSGAGDGDPTPSPSASPLPTPAEINPGTGDYTIGTHSLPVDGIPLSFSVPASRWEPSGSLSISKSTFGSQGAEAIIYWTTFPDGADADPCDYLAGLPVAASATDLAAAVAAAPGTELVSGPSDVTVGGRAAKLVVLTVREDVGCDPGFFYTWTAGAGGAIWAETMPGDTIRVWVVELDGARFFIVGETSDDSGPAVREEIQQIVNSIRFE